MASLVSFTEPLARGNNVSEHDFPLKQLPLKMSVSGVMLDRYKRMAESEVNTFSLNYTHLNAN